MYKKKILYVGLSYNPGGIESFAKNYIGHFCGDEFEFHLISMFEHLAFEEYFIQKGCLIHDMPNVNKKPLEYKKQFAHLLSKENYDVIHFNVLSAANLTALSVAEKYNKKRSARDEKMRSIIEERRLSPIKNK